MAADLLGYQCRAGRVRRVRRGIYAVIRNAFTRSTMWRCLNWRRVARWRRVGSGSVAQTPKPALSPAGHSADVTAMVEAWSDAQHARDGSAVEVGPLGCADGATGFSGSGDGS